MIVKGAYMAGTFIYLRIEGDELDFQDLEKQLKTRPTWVHKKGERFEDKRFHETVVYEKDCWMYEMEAEEGMTIGVLLDRFLNVLEADCAALRDLSAYYDIKFYVSAYPDSRHYSIDFSEAQLQKISSYHIPLIYTTLYLGE